MIKANSSCRWCKLACDEVADSGLGAGSDAVDVFMRLALVIDGAGSKEVFRGSIPNLGS